VCLNILSKIPDFLRRAKLSFADYRAKRCV
jgi:hypothetical protein